MKTLILALAVSVLVPQMSFAREMGFVRDREPNFKKTLESKTVTPRLQKDESQKAFVDEISCEKTDCC